MRIGKLDKIVGVKALVTSQSASGATNTSLAAAVNTWAQVTYPSGAERIENDKLTGVSTAYFIMRYQDLPLTSVVVYNSLEYEVVHVDIHGRNEYLRVKTELKQ